MGYYATLIVPLLIALVFTTKKLWHRIGYAFLAASLVLILFSSQSRAGIVIIIISLFIMLLCMRKVFIKNWKITAAAIAVFIIGFIGINMANQNILFTRMKSMFSTADEVHALKSTSMTIGAERLADQAKLIEQAGKKGNIEYIRHSHPILLRMYDEVCETILGL